MREKAIEEIYQKKSQLEHILIRPDTYVGSTEVEKSYKWVLREENLKFTNEEISYVPALYKIFDQVLVNAADNYQRDRKMNMLRVEINQEQGYVKVHNNGKGIPVQIHKQHNIYVPELIFGHLLTGSNYNDDEKKVVGGRNGYGAKLANIFSHKFVVECGDGRVRKKFKMVWNKNMTVHGQAQIEGYSGKDYTEVTYYPEFKRFNMRSFEKDIVSLMSKRVYDMAGLLPCVKVFLNEKLIDVNSFLKYVDLYFNNTQEIVKIRDEKIDNERWQVVLSTSEGEFRQVSFVNSICTSKGGTHVNYIVDQVVERVQEKIGKKDKRLAKIKPFQIKNHLCVFVNCLIVNPTFDSQTKETMTLKVAQFGSDCTLSQKMIKDVFKTGIVDQIIEEVNLKDKQKLNKMGGTKKAKISGISKLQDANEAGTKNSKDCTLILTEGDSAKSLAMAGIQIVGRDYYGVFPLKGKLLNVREASTEAIKKNEEVQNMMKIMGLQVGKEYDNVQNLRYGSIMIMSDQDTDGSHIKGLVVNFIHYFWPKLFRLRGFMKQFITPLLKASRRTEIHSFYSLGEFKSWAQTVELKQFKIKYYKGLGTSSDKEAQEYFSQIERNRIFFQYTGNQDDQSMDLVFNKKKAENRKEWLSHYDPSLVLDYTQRYITYKDFIDKEFIHFSNQDNQRSIVNIIDGFKQGQRKIIYACFKRNLKEEIKVAQLAGYVSQHSAYHHGQMSLTMTIVAMAQSFVGSNNINLLMPNGQFGSRNQGGKDHASARYIFTNLSKATRYIFPQPDDHTLTYIEDDGQMVEPQFYMPIIPMALVNGADGIGSGWSTHIPNFDPRELANVLIRKLQGDEFIDVHPCYKGFSGQINLKEDSNYQIKGKIDYDDDKEGVVHIRELPIGKWTKDYKDYIQEQMGLNNPKVINMREHHTKNRVHFQLQLSDSYYNQCRNQPLQNMKFFKLVSNISMRNMVGFNRQNRLIRYPTAKVILQDFYQIRLEYYDKRKDYLMSKLKRDVQQLTNKERFIIEVIEETIVLRNVKRKKIVQMLKERGYQKFSELTKIKTTKSAIHKKETVADEDKDDQGEGDERTDQSREFNYLLSMPLWNLTYEKVETIKRQAREKRDELKQLENTSLKQLWKKDLNSFVQILDKLQIEEEEDRKKGDGDRKQNAKGQKARRKVAMKDKPKEKKKGYDWDEDDFEPETKAEEKIVKAKRQVKPAADKPIKEKKAPSKKVEEEEGDDLMSRVKRNIMASNQDAGSLKVVAKMKNSKQVSINDFLNPKDPNENFELALVSSKRSNQKKKKMVLDSSEQQDEQQSDWQGFE